MTEELVVHFWQPTRERKFDLRNRVRCFGNPGDLVIDDVLLVDEDPKKVSCNDCLELMTKDNRKLSSYLYDLTVFLENVENVSLNTMPMREAERDMLKMHIERLRTQINAYRFDKGWPEVAAGLEGPF